MGITSNWPLPPDGIRFLLPKPLLTKMAEHPLTQSLYPIALGYYPFADSHHMQRLDHDNYLLIYCTAGYGSLSTKKGDFSVSKGDLILLPKHMSHSYQADKHKPWTLYFLHFDGHQSEHFYQQLSMTAPSQNIGLHPRLVHIFDELLELKSCGYQLPHFIHACHQLQAMLSYLALLMQQQHPQNNKAIDLQQIKTAMLSHIHSQLNLDDLALESKLSKYHFARKFKQLVGQSPIQYFINMKMQHACHLLDSSNRSIKQISLELGYEDAYYFSRLFKKVIGLSPEQYRKSKIR